MRCAKAVRGVVFVIFVLAFIMGCKQGIRADMIFTPINSFYEKHHDECEYLNRSYRTNGPDNKVVLYESPVSSKVIDTFENDRELYISYTYKDNQGILWGVYGGFDKSESGWIPMDYLQVVYDYISFQEDYGDSIVEKSGTLDDSLGGKSIYFWSYPGSRDAEELELDTDHLPEYSQCFKDENGHNWGFVTYYMSRKNQWICLDAPMDSFDKLYKNDAPVRDTEVAKPTTKKIVPDNSSKKNMVGIVAGLVSLVVVVTVLILFILKKKK